MDSCFVWEVSIAYEAIVMDSCTHPITDSCFFSPFFFTFLFFKFFCIRNTSIIMGLFFPDNASMIMGSFFV